MSAPRQQSDDLPVEELLVCEDEDEDEELEVHIPILFVGTTGFPYKIPSFPAFTVNLRHMKYQFTDENGDNEVYDGFIRNCPILDVTSTPYLVTVEKGCENAFFIEAS